MSSKHSRSRAVRLFAHELAEATKTLTVSDEERAPQYQLLASGGLANRVFVVGTVTEIEDVGSSSEYWKARVVDPNGDTFFVYAGQYQPDAVAAIRSLECPAYVSVVGKPQTFESDETTYVSIEPESVTVVDEQTRDRWVVETAEQTLDRIEAGLDGADAPGEAVDADFSPFTMAVGEYGQEVIEQVRQRATAAVATLQADALVGVDVKEPASTDISAD